jgi:tetratricopeptide (TPR) repeat protein
MPAFRRHAGWIGWSDVSEYQKAKQIIRKMRMGKKQSRELGLKAFLAEMDAGRPDIALKCAKDFKLEDDRVTEAATSLFLELIRRARFDKALEIARSYNLAHGGDRAAAALEAASQVQYDGGDSLAQIKRLARKASSARLEASEVDNAIHLIRSARQARDADPKIAGRAVVLPAEGEVWLTGDLHGNVENLNRFAQLADLENNPQRYLVVQEIVHSRLITADNRDLSFVAVMEAINLQKRFPGQVYYLLGNHDLAVHLDRELVKGGKYLNRYLFRGMAYMYRARYEEVLSEYRKFIADMPAAILAPKGVFMAHSTPKRAYVPSLSREYLTEESATKPLSKARPINAMVNGRDYHPDTAAALADQLEVDVFLCGHTPTNKGWRIPNDRHLIIDSQHGQAHYVRFDLDTKYATSQELAQGLGRLDPEAEEEQLTSEDLM